MPKTQHEEVMYELGLLKGEVRGIHNEFKAMNGTVKKNVTDIDDIQRNQNKMLGATAVISSMFLFVGGVLAKIFIK